MNYLGIKCLNGKVVLEDFLEVLKIKYHIDSTLNVLKIFQEKSESTTTHTLVTRRYVVTLLLTSIHSFRSFLECVLSSKLQVIASFKKDLLIKISELLEPEVFIYIKMTLSLNFSNI